MSSSEIVNILQNLTFGFLTSHFMGGAQRRPLILGVSAREARGQAEVRNPLRFLYLLCPKKNFCYNVIALNDSIAYFNGRLWIQLEQSS